MSYLDNDSKKLGYTFSNINLTPKQLSEIARMTNEGVINRKTAKHILHEAIMSGKLITGDEKVKDLRKIDDENVIWQTIERIFAAETVAVVDAKKNPNVANYLLGKVMQLTKGRADPKLALSLINKKLLDS
jgi:aspartyl-tRNA(Asn)/glutamyl-tRNA(Gln) amidotransferase subunit B